MHSTAMLPRTRPSRGVHDRCAESQLDRTSAARHRPSAYKIAATSHRKAEPIPWIRIKIALEPAMIRILNASVLIGTLAAFDPGALRGQTASPVHSNSPQLPSPPASVFSIGQPPIWRQQLTAQGAAYSQGDRPGGGATL